MKKNIVLNENGIGVFTAPIHKLTPEDLPPVEGGDKRYMSRDLCPVDLFDDFIKSSITTNNNKNLPGGETVD